MNILPINALAHASGRDTPVREEFAYGPEITKAISWEPMLTKHAPGYERGFQSELRKLELNGKFADRILTFTSKPSTLHEKGDTSASEKEDGTTGARGPD